jgi:MoaA/NifB/PqqE/SkfB family radical SAM enzyme
MELPPLLRNALRRPHPSRRPRIPLFQRVVVELQSHCNRECFFCCRESDTRGKRKTADGKSVRRSMPTEKVMALFDELEALEFRGFITFHQLSEAFLDERLIDVAREATRRGMRPYVHTNGDVLRNDERLCAQTAEVFEYVVVGLYDYTSDEERDFEKDFWKRRLRGTQVMFSLVENVYTRTHSPDNAQMHAIVRATYPNGVCAEPLKYLMIHYNGDVCCCCEDMYGELLKVNIFETSIRDIWYSPRHVQVIDDLLRGERHKYDLCAKCTRSPNRYSQDPMTETEHLGK